MRKKGFVYFENDPRLELFKMTVSQEEKKRFFRLRQRRYNPQIKYIILNWILILGQDEAERGRDKRYSCVI